MNLSRRPRKSMASLADRPSGRPPLFYVSPRALRLTGWAMLHATILGATVGGLWWRHVNIAPPIVIPTHAAPSSNAYPTLVDAANRLVKQNEVGEAIATPRPNSLIKGHMRAEKVYALAEKEELLAANADALRTFRGALPSYAEAPAVRDWKMSFPELAGFRGMARLLLLEGQVHAARGDYGKAANSYLNAIELGERIGHGGVLIHKLVSIACEAIGRRGLLEVSDKLSPDEARAAVARLETILSRRSTMTDALTEEKWATQAELDRWFRTKNWWQIAQSFPQDAGLEDEEHKPSFTDRTRFALGLMRYTKTEVAESHRRYMDAIIAQSQLPYDRARPEPTIPPDYLNQILMPVFVQANFRDVETRAEYALLLGKLAVSAYLKQTGHKPTDWNALVQSGYLHAAPVDPFAKNGTDPLRYDPLTYTQVAFRIYSVGPDGKDNGGTPIPPDKDNRTRRWIQASDNGDFVLGVNYAEAGKSVRVAAAQD